jgi:hypothetical protein
MASRMTAGQISELVENPGTAIREPAVAILTIDTADSDIYDASGYITAPANPNQVYINTQQTLVNGYFTRLALTEIKYDWNIPNVIDDLPWRNNRLTLEFGVAGTSGNAAAEISIIVPQNFYTPVELAAEVQRVLLLMPGVFASPGWQCTWFDRFNTFLIADVSGNVPIRIVPRNRNDADDLCNLMGFSVPSKTFAFAINGSFAPMTYTPFFDVTSQQLTKKQNVGDSGTSKNTGRNLLARIYLANEGAVNMRDRTTTIGLEAESTIIGTRPFLLYKQFVVPKQIYWDTKEFINVVDITLLDYKGRVLYNQPLNSSIIQNLGAPGTQCGSSSSMQLTLQVTET